MSSAANLLVPLAGWQGLVALLLFAVVEELNEMQDHNVDAALLTRAAVIELVLGTDMKQHFNILSLFQVCKLHSTLHLSSEVQGLLEPEA